MPTTRDSLAEIAPGKGSLFFQGGVIRSITTAISKKATIMDNKDEFGEILSARTAEGSQAMRIWNHERESGTDPLPDQGALERGRQDALRDQAAEDHTSASNFKKVLEGIKEAKRGNTHLGLQLLKGSVADSRIPEAKAWHGYCLATEKKAFREGISLCNEAIQLQSESAESYLALGRIYLLAGRRIAAINALRQGRYFDNSRELDKLLSSVNHPVRFYDN